MKLTSLHRQSVSRNQPVIVARKSWDLNFKATVVITPRGRWSVRRKDGTRFEARFTFEEWAAKDWEEISSSESLPTRGSANTQEDPTAPL